MIIKLIRIKNDLLKKLRKILKFKEILEIFERFYQILKNFFKCLYSLIIFK